MLQVTFYDQLQYISYIYVGQITAVYCMYRVDV